MNKPSASRTEQLDMFDNRCRKRISTMPPPLEASEQEALFQWARIAAKKYPELRLLHAIPNGGFRYKSTAAAMKRQGVLPGVPDVCLPVPKRDAGALYIELKRKGKGRDTSKAQDGVIEALIAAGNVVRVCEGWEAAKEEILRYLR